MAFAQGSRSYLSYIEEVTFGTTPTTPSMVILPYNSQTLSLSKETLESEEIRSDRQRPTSRHGNRQIGGDIVTELRADDHDILLESACFGDFTTGVLKVGTTPKYVSVEDGAEDISQYRLFTGIAVSTAAFSVGINKITNVTYSVVGKDMAISGTPVDASPTAASGSEPFDSYSGAILEGGSSVATVTSFDFSIENSLSPTFVIGSDATPELEYGAAIVSGTIVSYFENASLINKFINETSSTLQLSLTDGTNTYTFDFPNVKYNSADVPTDNEQSRMVTLNFMAHPDATEGTNLKITKS